jgi:AraC family transcriptional regulator, transcriptional activator of pobA
VRGATGGAHHLKVPPAERPSWSERLVALELELHQKHVGYQEAVLANMTLLLVAVSRLAADIVGDLRLNQAPLLAEVFGVIEKSYRERLSLKDVSGAVSMSPGHLTRSSGVRRGARSRSGSSSVAWGRRGVCCRD